MYDPTDDREPTAAELRLALSDVYPETSYGAVPVIDQYDALESYRAAVESDLQAIPGAHAAYLCHQLSRCS